MFITDAFPPHRKGLVYLDVPISDSDCISVPPLEGFVMNRVLGDYLESLMYKIFVSIDEHTPVSEVRYKLFYFDSFSLLVSATC